MFTLHRTIAPSDSSRALHPSNRVSIPQHASIRHPRAASRSLYALRPLHLCCSTAAQEQDSEQSPSSSSSSPSNLESWLAAKCGVGPGPLKVQRRLVAEGLWGLVATADIEPGEVLMSVPQAVCLFAEAKTQREALAQSAQQLLRREREGQLGGPWLRALPQREPLPWLFFNGEELEALQEPAFLDRCRELRAHYEKLCAKLCKSKPKPSGKGFVSSSKKKGKGGKQEAAGSPITHEQLAWALSVVWSRSFGMGPPSPPGSVVLPPGLDFCNHSLVPSASMRAANAQLSDGPDAKFRVELVAREGGLRAGEEVTLNYGSVFDEDFLLGFGFLPKEPGGALVFSTPAELVENYHLAALGEQCQPFRDAAGMEEYKRRVAEYRQNPEAFLKKVLALLDKAAERGLFDPKEDNPKRLGVMASGEPYPELLKAAQAAAALYPEVFGATESPVALPTPEEFLQRYCIHLLRCLPTSLEEDEALLEEKGGSMSANMAAAVQYRMRRKDALEAAVEAVGG